MTTMMNAAVYERYGPPEVVKIKSVPRPTLKPDQVLIEVHATSVTTGDARLRAWNIPSLVFSIPARIMLGIFKPRTQILGTSAAGVIQEVGPEVEGFSVGDRVLGSTEMKMSGHAEFVAVQADGSAVHIPDHISFEEAAGITFGGPSALYFLRDLGKLQAGQRVLINGASGALGSSGIQLAKHLGAHVTAVCSGNSHEFVRSLGADDTIDYTQEDFTTRELSDDQRFHAIFDTIGKTNFRKCKHLLVDDGVFLPAVMRLPELLQLLLTPLLSKRRVKSGVAMTKPEKLKTLMELVDAGAIKPAIDSVYPFAEISAAHRHVDNGHKRGNVIVRVIESTE
jgi:NADPH:quinone reductase-like Zn-dependent oxidoreductase